MAKSCRDLESQRALDGRQKGATGKDFQFTGANRSEMETRSALFLVASFLRGHSGLSHQQSHCLEAHFRGRILFLITYHPDSCLRSLLYVLALLGCVIAAGFTRETSPICSAQRMGLAAFSSAEWLVEGGEARSHVNLQVYRNQMLWKDPVSANDPSHSDWDNWCWFVRDSGRSRRGWLETFSPQCCWPWCLHLCSIRAPTRLEMFSLRLTQWAYKIKTPQLKIPSYYK